MMQSQKTVEGFLAKHDRWKDALIKFREILLNTELEESIKWGIPVYSLHGKNVLGIGAFKSYVGLWFYQGAFLKDLQKLLINAQDGKTKAMRQLRFTSEQDIDLAVVKSYIDEAIKNQKAGKEMKPDIKKPLIIPTEIQTALDSDAALKSSFENFTPGKQREFSDYVSEAKQKATKLRRTEKIIPLIREGKGLNDKYRK
jgi:uncharacterized protein YdeI (YjbR/CyaY-like superfamily)